MIGPGKGPATDRDLAILILRTVSLSQDSVCLAVTCGKTTVNKVENWFKNQLAFKHAKSFSCDDAIQRVIEREFVSYGLTEDQLAKAKQIIGDDLLRHYRSPVESFEDIGTPTSNLEREAKRRCDYQDHEWMSDGRFELYAYTSKKTEPERTPAPIGQAPSMTRITTGETSRIYLDKTCVFCGHLLRKQLSVVSID